MVNISNAFAGILCFFIVLLLTYIFNPIMMYIINLFTDTLLRGVILAGYMFFNFLFLFYFPIIVLTAEDNPKV